MSCPHPPTPAPAERWGNQGRSGQPCVALFRGFVLLVHFLSPRLGEGEHGTGKPPAPAQSMCLLLESQIPARSAWSILGWLGNSADWGGGGGKEASTRGGGEGRAGACRPRILKPQKSANTWAQAGENRLRYTLLCQDMVAHPRSLGSFGAP